MQVNRDQSCFHYYPSNKQRSLGNHHLRIVKAHASQNLEGISPASPEPYSQPFGFLRLKGRSLLRVDLEQAFIPALKSRAWVRSKGQKRPPFNLAESLPRTDYLSAISIRLDRFGLRGMTICLLFLRLLR